MADPATMAGAGMAGKAGGAVLGAIGALFSGDAQSNMYKYQAGIAMQNAKLHRQNADYQRKVGEVQAQEVGLKAGAEIGQTKATQGASGIDVNRGSTVAVRNSEHEIGVQNQTIVRSNAAHRAYGEEVEAANADSQALVDLQAGKTAKTASYLNAFSSILGGASSVADKWYQGNSVGLGSTAKTDDSLLIYGPGN